MFIIAPIKDHLQEKSTVLFNDVNQNLKIVKDSISSSSGTGSVNLTPYGFTTTPVIVATSHGNTNGYMFSVSIYNQSPTGFSWKHTSTNGSTVFSAGEFFSFIAIGY